MNGSWHIIAGEYVHGMKLLQIKLAWVWYKVAADGLLKRINPGEFPQHSHSLNQYDCYYIRAVQKTISRLEVIGYKKDIIVLPNLFTSSILKDPHHSELCKLQNM